MVPHLILPPDHILRHCTLEMSATGTGCTSGIGAIPTDPNLESLGEEVCNLSKKIARYLRTNNFPPPSFHENSPSFYPKNAECQVARLELLGKLQDLWTLALGPAEFLTSHIIYVSPETSTIVPDGLH